MQLFAVTILLANLAAACKLSLLVKNVRMSRLYRSQTESEDVAEMLTLIAPPIVVPAEVKDKLIAWVKAIHKTFAIHKAVSKVQSNAAGTKWKVALDKYHKQMSSAVIELLYVTDPTRVAAFEQKTKWSELSWKKAMKEVASNAEGSTCKYNSILSLTGGLKEIIILEIEKSADSIGHSLAVHLGHNIVVALKRLTELSRQTSFKHELLSGDALAQFDSAAIERGMNPGSVALNHKVVCMLSRYDISSAILTAECLRSSLISYLGENLFNWLWKERVVVGRVLPMSLREADSEYKRRCSDQIAASNPVGPAFDAVKSTREVTRWCSAFPIKSKLAALQADSADYREKMTQHHRAFVSKAEAFCQVSLELLKL